MDSQDQGFASGVIDQCDDWIEKLCEQGELAMRTGEKDAVHHARVACRRLNSVVELLAPIVKKKSIEPFRVAIKKIRRKLGPIRDADVGMKLLREAPVPAEAGAGWMVDRLNDSRSRQWSKYASSKLLGKLDRYCDFRLVIEACSEAIPCRLAESLHEQSARFIELADGLHDENGSTEPHALRRAGKQLRYTLELAEAARMELPENIADLFKSMQDALGDWHDAVVLIESIGIESVDAQVARHDLTRQRSLVELSSWLTEEAGRHLTAFDQIWAETGSSALAELLSRFPLVEPVIESKTDLDPFDSPEPSMPEAPPTDAVPTE